MAAPNSVLVSNLVKNSDGTYTITTNGTSYPTTAPGYSINWGVNVGLIDENNVGYIADSGAWVTLPSVPIGGVIGPVGDVGPVGNAGLAGSPNPWFYPADVLNSDEDLDSLKRQARVAKDLLSEAVTKRSAIEQELKVLEGKIAEARAELADLLAQTESRYELRD